MANLDTRSKRASSVSILLASVLAPVLPDATIGQGDRQHTANRYSGILAAAPDVTGPPLYLRGSTQASIYLDGSTQATLYGRGSTQATFTIRGAV